MTNLGSILKSKDITLLTKVYMVKAMVFPVVMYAFESWTIEKADCWRTDAFELWCWRRFLRVPFTARRSNQYILREISPEYSLERLMLKWNSNILATLCKELTHWKKPWCWERLMAEEEGDESGWDIWIASPAQWTWVSARPGIWWETGNPGVQQSMGLQRVRYDRATEQQPKRIQIKLQWRYYLTPVRIAIIKMYTSNQCWRRCGEKQIFLHSLWEYNMMQPLWKK